MFPNESPHRNRLWTPWRMRYIANGPAEDGCIFCNRLARSNDIESLILHRSDHSFIIMNLFPYNTGHVMVVPNDHTAAIDQLTPGVVSEMARLLQPLIRALRRVLNCQGFNIGFNQGSIAGAGVAEHLHQHVVPRWEGDANFMPILAGTMVIPELIPSSYAKIRAELDAEIYDVSRFEILLLDEAEAPSVWLHDGQVPTITASGSGAIWRTAVRDLGLDDAEIVGYSGAEDSRNHTVTPGLVIRTSTPMHDSGWTRRPLLDSTEDDELSYPVRETLNRVIDSLRPWIAAREPAPEATKNPLD